MAFLGIYAQQDTSQCPFSDRGGRLDCTGYCGNFNDKNADGFCDYSVLSSEKKVETKKAKTETRIQENKTKEKIIESKEEFTETKEDIIEKKETVETTTLSETTTTQTTNIPPAKRRLTGYQLHFWYICFAIIGIYLLSAVLVKTQKIKKATHRKFWNTILLTTFLVSGLLGLYVAMAKIYEWNFNYTNTMIYHVDFGVAMSIVSLIHIFWHLSYFKNIIKNAKQ